MKPQYIMLRLGELTLKGKNRNYFENKVLNAVREALKEFPKAKTTKSFGRMYIELRDEPYEAVAAQLKKIFGLVSFSPVVKTELDLAEIQEVALKFIQEQPSAQTFKVVVRRVNKAFPYNSPDLNGLIGGYVLTHAPQLKVDVHHPDTEIRVEVREQGAFVFSSIVPGLGGFPSNSNGRAMLMLSGGIDSPVAGWLAMKKGVQIEAVHFHSYPYTSERAKHKVIQLTRQLAAYTQQIKLHLVPLTEIQVKLQEQVQPNLLITLTRRAMLRIAEKLAYKQKAKAIVTGESLGQVASQTLPSLNVIGRATSLPILQPLIAFDKNEIIQLAEQIGTYTISILPYEDCCTIFMPKSPSTKPKLAWVEREEAKLSWLNEYIHRAVEQTEVMTITQKDLLHDEFF